MVLTRPLLALLLAALALFAPASGWTSKPIVADDADYAIETEVLPPASSTDGFGDGDFGPAYGERILSWRSDITVRADTALDVTETIIVNAEGADIRRGIYRDFPTIYQQPGTGRRIRVGFDVHGVERDGRPEPYRVESIANGRRVRIGDEDVLIPRGRHTYVIRYTTTRQLGYFADYDELFWNVTGNFWVFPIDRAEVRIRLPQAVAFGRERAFYTGPQGSRASDAEVVSERPGEIVIRTTARLGPREGLTVAVRWPTGVVAAPAPPSAARLWFQAFAPPIAAVWALLGLGFFY